MSSTDFIQVQNVSKSFLAAEKMDLVLNNISFSIKKGEIISILGKSGCGKSTLLNILGGFEQADDGAVVFDGEVVNRPNRRCIMLFQNYGLLPWRSVLKNVEFGLESLNLNPKERKERAMHYLKLVNLDDRANVFPNQLSGGMQQRVAIARALAVQPELILMDEPFAALDTFNRYYLQDELLELQEKEKTTIVLVTHDIDEAIYLSDRILMMSSNPGTVHKELKIGLSRPRDRSHGDFQYFRKIILNEFQFNHPTHQEGFSI